MLCVVSSILNLLSKKKSPAFGGGKCCNFSEIKDDLWFNDLYLYINFHLEQVYSNSVMCEMRDYIIFRVYKCGYSFWLSKMTLFTTK